MKNLGCLSSPTRFLAFLKIRPLFFTCYTVWLTASVNLCHSSLCFKCHCSGPPLPSHFHNGFNFQSLNYLATPLREGNKERKPGLSDQERHFFSTSVRLLLFKVNWSFLDEDASLHRDLHFTLPRHTGAGCCTRHCCILRARVLVEYHPQLDFRLW